MTTRYVAIEREDLAEVRRLIDKIRVDGEDDSEEALLRFLDGMEVIGLSEAVARELGEGSRKDGG